MDKIKKKNIYNYVFILSIILLSLLVIIPICMTDFYCDVDLPYHLASISSLNQSWQNGTFLNRIYEFIGNDYGYGIGLFYSMLPSAIAVIIMNVLNVNLTIAIFLELFILTSITGVCLYYFIKRFSGSIYLGFICAIIYILMPYQFFNIFIRFAFSEIFFTLPVVLTIWGLIELIKFNNYKLFIPLFTSGVSLAILTHFSLSIYLGIFVILLILINIKDILKNYKWVPLILSIGISILISTCYLLPMIMNYGLVSINQMQRSLSSIWLMNVKNLCFNNFFITNITQIAAYVIYLILFIYKWKKLSKPTIFELSIFVVSSLSILMLTPLFPWPILPNIFGIIQFSHRLFMINNIFFIIELMQIFIDLKQTKFKTINFSKKLRTCFITFICIISISYLCNNIGIVSLMIDSNSFSFYNNYNEITETGFSFNNGLGWSKNGDYFTKGLTSEYLNNRVKENIIVDESINSSEIINLQNKNIFSFLVTPENNSYVTLNIPYSLSNNLNIYAVNTNCFNESYNDFIVENSNDLIKINFNSKNNEIKIVFNYANSPEFKEYLQNNPFEFIVKSGDANFSEFIKTNSHTYSVKATVSGETTIELPTFAYKGYKVTLTNENGEKELNASLGEHGFLEVTTSESGVISIEFVGTYIKVANIISIIGIILFIAIMTCILLIPRKYFTRIADKVTKLFKEKPILGEIVRFIIVGGIATIVDFLCMGLLMYLVQKNIYSSFINVFINAPTPSTLATILGTSFGFICGLIVNYILSILFVFNEKGNSKSTKGFIIFTVLSIIGLLINILGTFIGFDLLHINQWVVKIIMTIIVLIYNYISKKLVLFKKKSTPVFVDTDSQTKLNLDSNYDVITNNLDSNQQNLDNNSKINKNETNSQN